MENQCTFPKNLEERIGAVSLLTNTETKEVTLLSLDHIPAPGSEILSRMKQGVRRNTELPKGSVITSYCHDSLPAGLVREQIKEGQSLYSISEAGKEYGIPLAVYSLKWGVENGLSLYSILGRQPTTPLKVPYRIQILKLLRHKKSLREVDLSDETGLVATGILNHLKSLREIGFINYDSIKEPHELKGDFKYEYVEQAEKVKPKTVAGLRDLTNRVLEEIKNGKADFNKVSERLRYPHPNHVSVILSGLERQGFVKSDTDFKFGKKLSRATITRRGGKFVDEHVATFENALSDGAVLTKLKREAEIFLDDTEMKKEILTRAIENYWAVSSNRNSTPSGITNSKIVDFLERHPGARTVEIEKSLGLSKGTDYLTPLVETGVLKKRRIDKNNKNAIGYFIDQGIVV